VNDEVEIRLPGGPSLVAIVTRESTENLGLAEGAAVIAMVGANSVIIATGLAEGSRVSARNRLAGTIASVVRGAVNAEVILDIDGGVRIAATVTLASADDMALVAGARAVAM